MVQLAPRCSDHTSSDVEASSNTLGFDSRHCTDINEATETGRGVYTQDPLRMAEDSASSGDDCSRHVLDQSPAPAVPNTSYHSHDATGAGPVDITPRGATATNPEEPPRTTARASSSHSTPIPFLHMGVSGTTDSFQMELHLRLPCGTVEPVTLSHDATIAQLNAAARKVLEIRRHGCVPFSLDFEQQALDDPEEPLSETGVGNRSVVDVLVSCAVPSYAATMQTEYVKALEKEPIGLSKTGEYVMVRDSRKVDVYEVKSSRLIRTIRVGCLNMEACLCASVAQDGTLYLACVDSSVNHHSIDMFSTPPGPDGAWADEPHFISRVETSADIPFMGTGTSLVALHLQLPSKRSSICVFDAVSAPETTSLSLKSSWDLPFGDFRGVAVSPSDDRVAVVNNNDSCVQIYGSSGAFLCSIGDSTVLGYPQDVSFDCVGNVIIGGSSVAAQRALGVFTSSGVLLHVVKVGCWVWSVHIMGSKLVISTDTLSCPVLVLQ
ncbi:hypothetical protein DIPPA_59013 [Diplonema papillatum]|nr:hypothetical protein DIPPA_59013 [Diplonema papillatum]